MNIEEIHEIVASAEAKLNEVKSVLSDINVCSSERSKTILLAAASKLVESFKLTNTNK